ncbi:MAG: molybdopterin-dependent oxidoreductase [Acidobacteria bacterium]|nr:molybdopterin-dependent oxidoreductase [Acidobacteriota bacterium]
MATRVSYKWHSKLPGDGVTRRLLLTGAAAGVLQAQQPETSGFDLSLLDDDVVPNDLFFVREHYPQPAGLSSAGWRVRIGGAVAEPFDLVYDELTATPSPRRLAATIECAENPVDGGLVSHAEWTGCSLGALLEKARVRSGAKFVRLTGADGFSRCLPIEKAMHADTILAHGMNGERLPASHGFPVRAIVPGWYGMDSVKWLKQVEAVDGADPGDRYLRSERSLLTGVRPAGPVREGCVKSAFSRPLDGAILSSRRFTIRGVAWAGQNRVRQVEVSVDGGKSWRTGRLASPPRPYAWVQWTFDWMIGRVGSYELMVRAADDAGRAQPEARPSNRADGFELNSYQTVRVVVS